MTVRKWENCSNLKKYVLLFRFLVFGITKFITVYKIKWSYFSKVISKLFVKSTLWPSREGYIVTSFPLVEVESEVKVIWSPQTFFLCVVWIGEKYGDRRCFFIFFACYSKLLCIHGFVEQLNYITNQILTEKIKRFLRFHGVLLQYTFIHILFTKAQFASANAKKNKTACFRFKQAYFHISDKLLNVFWILRFLKCYVVLL